MISSKKMKFAVTTAAAAAVVCTGALAANVTSTTNVNVRSGPGNSYSVLTVMKSGTTTSKLGASGNWTKVNVNGKTGYVYNKYLSNSGGASNSSASNNTTSTSKTVYVTASALNVRSGAGTSYSVIGGLSKGQSASVVGTSGNWYKIKYGSGYGYINSSYTKSTATTSSASSSSKTYYCTTAGLNVRSGPGTSYASKGSLSRGQAVTVVDSSSYWYKIQYGNGYGYVGSKYLSASKPSGSASTSATNTTSTAKKTVYTTCSLNVRSGAGTSYSVIGVLSPGKSATVVGSSGKWYKIQYGSGYGYISSSYTTSSAPSGGSGSSSTAPSTSSSSSIVSYAKTFLGRPYVYGASGPSSFDCSGFTQYVYKHFGKSIPRSSAAQYSSCYKISKSSLRAGDLVFFSNSSSGGSVGHVAIYMGNGQIIHAANSRRDVCTDSLNSSYYTQHYVGAGRY